MILSSPQNLLHISVCYSLSAPDHAIGIGNDVVLTLAKSAAKKLLPPDKLIHLRGLQFRFKGPAEVKRLADLCDRSKTSIDVGANVGAFAYLMLGHSADVICYEPNPEMARLLRASLPDRVTVIERAASDRAEQATLHVPLAAAGGAEQAGWGSLEKTFDDTLHVKAVQIATCRLDDMNHRNVGFIKIDVEGHELAALSGARRTIERERPNLLVEAEERHSSGAVGGVFNLMTDLNYHGLFAQNDQWHPVAEFDIATMQNPDNAADLSGDGHGVYINNFLFLPDRKAVRRFIGGR